MQTCSSRAAQRCPAAAKSLLAAASRRLVTPRRPLATPSAASSRSAAVRLLSTSSARPAKNQIYAPIRNPDSLQTYLSLSASSHTPLLTLWTASYCATCRTVEPLLRSLVQSGVGQEEGGVAFAPVEFDSPDMMGSSMDNPAMTYMITAIPTLLSFDAGEAQVQTKIVDARRLADRQFLVEWIRTEARRHGGRGGGGGGSSIFAGLFGSGR